MVLIHNPAARRGRSERALPIVTYQLEARGLRYEIRTTRGPGEACELTSAALREGTRLVVAVGGDGTVHEVVNGMIVGDESVEPEAAFGVIPAGGSSDFIKTFGLPHLPAHAVAHLEGSDAFPIDIGKLSYRSKEGRKTRYFANISQAGLGADVARRAPCLPGALGALGYPIAFWMTLSFYTRASATVDLTDRTYEGPLYNLVVANGQFFGGGMKVAPKAAPTDGLLDIQIQNPDKHEALALLPKVYRGEHVPHPDIKEFKRAAVGISADRPLTVEADGEVLGHTPATFELLQNALLLKV